MEKQPSPGGEILLYENGGKKEFVSVVFQDETFWMYSFNVLVAHWRNRVAFLEFTRYPTAMMASRL